MRPVKKQANNHIEEITEQAKREWRDVDLDNILLAVYLQRLGTMIERDFERYCHAQFKLRPSDVRIVLALSRAGPPYVRRPTDLFRSLLVSSGAVTKQVDRLATKHLVTRFPDPSYGGGSLIQLTERGRKLVSEVLSGLASGLAVAPAMWTLPAQDRKAVARFCYSAITLLENSRSEKRGLPIVLAVKGPNEQGAANDSILALNLGRCRQRCSCPRQFGRCLVLPSENLISPNRRP